VSPLVERPRPAPSDQHWSLLLFESLSAGVLAIAVGLAVVMVAVGVYTLVVWPLTFWDVAQVSVEEYTSWEHTVLWSVFAGGSLAGYWCFSGAAFKDKRKRTPAPPARATRRRG
jgi:cell division septal protein FtsQ